MWDNLYEYTKKIDDCSNVEQIKVVCADYIQQLGGQFFKYNWQPSFNETDPISFFTCPDSWLNHYIQQGYDTIDPKVRYSNNCHQPIEWNEQLIGKKIVNKSLPIEDVAFWQDTMDMGLANGVTIPIRSASGSKGMLCIAYEGSYVKNEIVPLPLLEVWAMHLHNVVERLYIDEYFPEPLTAREREILKWTAIGKTAAEIADILFISKDTVLFHFSNLRRKLNVTNKHHLIAKAFSLRLIDF